MPSIRLIHEDFSLERGANEAVSVEEEEEQQQLLLRVEGIDSAIVFVVVVVVGFSEDAILIIPIDIVCSNGLKLEFPKYSSSR